MEQSAIDIMHECSMRSGDGTITFPEVVGKLMQIGVETYHADFYRKEKTYYLPSGESHIEPLKVPDEKIATDFSAADVEKAIRASQAGEIKFAEFTKRVMAAGCVGYFVCLTGRRAIYFGRTGDSHVEMFPK